MIVTTELWHLPLTPLVDERFFSAGLVASVVLRTLGGVPVPDLRKRRSKAGASVARGLGDMVKETLAHGGSMIFYPSGHIQTEPGREDIGTRQLAYNICRDLPPDVAVIGVRTAGLWGSIWSREGRTFSPPFLPTLARSVLMWLFIAPFRRRRKVTLQLEELTECVKEWASTMSRLAFNRKLEAWYNDSTAKN